MGSYYRLGKQETIAEQAKDSVHSLTLSE